MARPGERLAQAVKFLFAGRSIVALLSLWRGAMIQVAAGHLMRMQALESELLAKGYKKVGHQSELRPMEYRKTNDFAGGKWSFSLAWNDPEPSGPTPSDSR
jgi:hypothetical protein